MSGKEIARNFGIPEGQFSMVFCTWINLLQSTLKKVLHFPKVHQIQAYLPPSFKNFSNTRLVLDTTELRIQRPSSLNAQRQTFSNYKHYNTYKPIMTYKVIIGCTPDGYVGFVSKLWGGSVSDITIVEESGVLWLLEPGDAIMVDKGFKFTHLPPDVKVYCPEFRQPHELQMKREAVLGTRQIAGARVHVERVIGRVKQFHILQTPLPISMIDVAEQIFHVCCYLSNFRPPLILNRMAASADTPTVVVSRADEHPVLEAVSVAAANERGVGGRTPDTVVASPDNASPSGEVIVKGAAVTHTEAVVAVSDGDAGGDAGVGGDGDSVPSSSSDRLVIDLELDEKGAVADAMDFIGPAAKKKRQASEGSAVRDS
ncbi:uncharacterized protein LOC135400379 [Ornithodoros turicata]|uniref:uncharacterized protein LOC135400379 n=1 Tax=Ornithodoros turicata TaxID=34597 RepID=UPI003139E6AA